MPPINRATKVIGIVGSRRRDNELDYVLCRSAFKKIYRSGDRIVSGGCPQGADRFAEELAKEIGITITIHYPRQADLDYELLKVNPRAAYAIINHARNTLIAEDADVLIALVADDRKGGTEDTVKKAKKLNKKIVIVERQYNA